MSKNQINTYDLFDTLVARRVRHPHDVFRLVEAKSGVIGFCESRIRAEARIFSSSYDIYRIYGELESFLKLESTERDRLLSLELAVEWDVLFPIKEMCHAINPSDLIVSDMYLPEYFVRNILDKKCDLPFNTLILTSHGKRNGTIWSEITDKFEILSHTGDNGETDVKSPLAYGIHSHLYEGSAPTSMEADLFDAGLQYISEAVRELRLSTYSRAIEQRSLQLAQSQFNIPMLMVASLLLIQSVRNNKWSKILFSSRDCYLLKRIFDVVAVKCGLKLETSYFLTSRYAKLKSSRSYKDYVQKLVENNRAVVVDICGTGSSIHHLLGEVDDTSFDVMYIHLMDSAVNANSLRDNSTCTTNYIHRFLQGGFDNNTFELLNTVAHPMVIDVVQILGVNTPIYHDIDYNTELAECIRVQHEIFDKFVTIITEWPDDRVSNLIDKVNPALLERIYHTAPQHAKSVEMFFQHQYQEEQIHRSVPSMTQQQNLSNLIADVKPAKLTTLANLFGSDKGTQVGHAHAYSELYEFLFERFRYQAFSMLEIGLHVGGPEAGNSANRQVDRAPSIAMWQDFFPNAMIHGFDISDFSHLQNTRFKFFQGDLSSPERLMNLSRELPSLKLIIDDGSHASYHQQLAFLHLFDTVEPGGFYVIEDLHWQPPFESQLPECRKTAAIFESYLKDGYLRLSLATSDLEAAINNQIQNVFVHRNDRGGIESLHMKMVVIEKRR